MDSRFAARARLKDAAIVLPFVGLLLLMPPFIGLFAPTARLAGIPVLVLYVFGVWGLLIVLAALLARRLDGTERRPPEPPPAPPPG